VTLRNIITGINANENVNVQDLFTVGSETVKTMEGCSVFSYSLKRNTKAIKVGDDRTIDLALLFQRFLVVSQSGELCLDKVMNFELCPYPPSLFEAKNLLCKPDKAQLAEAIRNHVTSLSDDAILQSVRETDHYVLDGGSLLHRLHWTEGCTYTSISTDYASFTLDRYGNATIVFDGYGGGPSIKDNTHQRRSLKHVANKVNISDETKFVGKNDDFLSNDSNKQAMVNKISECLRHKGCHVIQAKADADADIVKAAISVSSYKSTTVIGEDTDLLILLLYHVKVEHSKDLYFRSDKINPDIRIV